MSICAAIATILTFIVFFIDIALFGIVKERFHRQGIPAQYGNANWLTVGALGALLSGFCLGICGVFGDYRYSYRTYKV
jgi:hypothetical protein